MNEFERNEERMNVLNEIRELILMCSEEQVGVIKNILQDYVDNLGETMHMFYKIVNPGWLDAINELPRTNKFEASHIRLNKLSLEIIKEILNEKQAIGA